MSKFVLVEAISQFRQRYVIEVPDDHNDREYPCTAITWAEAPPPISKKFAGFTPPNFSPA